MIIMSLDESSGFENPNSPVFIGGILYDDHGVEGEEEKERSRIAWYYNKVFEEVGQDMKRDDAVQQYPMGLHMGHGADNLVSNVKGKVAATLSEFLKNGTYRGESYEMLLPYSKTSYIKFPREGEYYIWLVMKSEDGMMKDAESDTNFLLQDAQGDNLYFNMADEVMEHIIFHNPVLGQIERLHPYIATRSSRLIGCDESAYDEFAAMGYQKRVIPNKTGQTFQFSLMNGDVYRTLFVQKMMQLQQDFPYVEKGEFNVQSISYMKNDDAKEEYLYLADSICSYLGDTHPKHGKLKGEVSTQWIGEIHTLASKMVKDEGHVLLFAYDAIDVDFSAAWKAFEKGDYHEALAISYHAKDKKGAFSRFYQEKWFALLEEKIKSSRDIRALRQAISDIHCRVLSNELEQKRELFIYHFLEQIMQDLEKELTSERDREILYQFYNQGISLYSHVGDTKKAQVCYEKCKEYFSIISTEEILRCQNQYVVILSDSFRWALAKGYAESSLKYFQMLTQVRNEITEILPKTSYLPEEKAKSQLAQVLSLYRDPKAEEYYLSALKGMERDKANYNITLSYLLHFYLDMGKKDAYEEKATQYFGNKETPQERLQYLIENSFCSRPDFHFNFGLYVFVRGLHLFERDLITDNLWEILKDLPAYLKETLKGNPYLAKWDGLKGHPSYLICKYMRLLAMSRNDEAVRKKYTRYGIESKASHEKIICALEMFGEAEICHIIGKPEGRDQKVRKLEEYLLDPDHYFEAVRHAEQIPTDPEQKYQYYAQKFTFMYH